MCTASWGPSEARSGTDCGFTLLEVCINVALAGLLLVGTIGLSERAFGAAALQYTRDNVVWGMRWCQQLAVTKAKDANFRFSVYTPMASMYLGPTLMQRFQFPEGIQYHDGYLQLNTGNVRYAPDGSCEVGGVVQLESAWDQAVIHLYQGSGLQEGAE
ncbi:hypothetical protein GCM10025857_37290 [Alicyclobacillus contaminans]|uniref:hypothetical protein n=1 Tax=Alicyclobacillus contaminans TaxID=392016 RepID=UPI00047E8F49|nr:hypothetical protein [Alicyclobacillus contaminans]GMA52372.1 hypothetical protein GCM10025857_37290 [Alicyclobacillus contaminans]